MVVHRLNSGDEHFQLLEFANFKLGLTPPAELPWEYPARIRSWFQPAIAVLTLQALRLVGDRNPFDAAALLRVLSALLYGWALMRLIRCSRFWFESRELRHAAIAAACFLWFIPYLAVRFSSESWSGSLFYLGFASLVLAAREKAVSTRELGCAGLAMGFAFAARYQTGILIAAALAWFLWAGRPRVTAVVAVAAGLSVAIATSLLLDRWGYGVWVLTPWRYFQTNLI